MFFCLDDFSESENDSIFNYLMSYRDESSLSVVLCLKFLGDFIVKSQHIYEYVLSFRSVNIKIF